MPTLSEVQTTVDTWLTAQWTLLTARQVTHFTTNGRYWQGLRTHIGQVEYTDAVDGERIGDNLSSAPSDQPSSWNTVFPEFNLLALPAVFVVDVYQNASGHGWMITAYIQWNGTLYTRSDNGAGDETYRTQGWSVYAPE